MNDLIFEILYNLIVFVISILLNLSFFCAVFLIFINKKINK